MTRNTLPGPQTGATAPIDLSYLYADLHAAVADNASRADAELAAVFPAGRPLTDDERHRLLAALGLTTILSNSVDPAAKFILPGWCKDARREEAEFLTSALRAKLEEVARGDWGFGFPEADINSRPFSSEAWCPRWTW